MNADCTVSCRIVCANVVNPESVPSFAAIGRKSGGDGNRQNYIYAKSFSIVLLISQIEKIVARFSVEIVGIDSHFIARRLNYPSLLHIVVIVYDFERALVWK